MSSSAVVTPPQRKRDHVPNSKSSDSLPSPSEFTKANVDQRLKTGSRAVALPQNAAVGFHSASTLMKFNLFAAQKDPEEKPSKARKTKEKSAETKTTAKAKKSAKDAVPVDKPAKEKKQPAKKSEEKVKRPRKRKSDEIEGASALKHFEFTEAGVEADIVEAAEKSGSKIGTEETKAPTKPRKRRKTADKEEPTTDSVPKPVKARRRTSKSSAHFTPELHDAPQPEEAVAIADSVSREHGAGQEQYRSSARNAPQSTSTAKEADIYTVPSSSPKISQPAPEAPKINFAELQKDFGYDKSQSVSVSPVRDANAGEEARHKKRIEFLPDPNPKPFSIIIEQPGPIVAMPTKEQFQQEAPPLPPPASKEKKKKVSPKKGPGGITARSIARYAHIEPEPAVDPAKTSPHFAVFDKPVKPVPETHAEAAEEPKKATKTRKPRTKKNATEKEPKKKAAAKVKIIPPQPPKLASPQQHNAKLKGQNILFGTSSQLRQGVSPDLIRTIQISLHDTFAEAAQPDDVHSSPIQLHRVQAIRRRKSGMWDQSAEEGAGDVFHRLSDVEVPEELAPAEADYEAAIAYDDTTSPADAFAPTSFQPPSDLPDDTAAPVPSNGFWLSKNASPPREPVEDLPPITSTAITISSEPRLSLSPTRPALAPLSTNTKSPAKKFAMDRDAVEKQSTFSDVSAILERAVTQKPRGRPRKEINSDQPASPPKSRGRPLMVAVSSPGPQTPKKRGRPPKPHGTILKDEPSGAKDGKDRWTGFKNIDEIEDSEPDTTPSPPRKRVSPSGSQPLPLTTTEEEVSAPKRANTAIVNASHPRWPEVRAKLFPEITNTVTSAPPTHSIKHPSWHEKMLLYDPIVLEDLTDWLNEQGLRVEGKDKEAVEILPFMTQAWCEMNSICCLWREGLRGGVRVRY